MLREDYVSFEQAVRLNKLGFPQKYSEYWCTGPSVVFEDSCCPKDIFRVACPMLYSVAKWLREEKNIIIQPSLYNPCDPVEFETVIYCHYNEGYFDKQFEGVFKTYEEALSKGIDKSLELLENDNL